MSFPVTHPGLLHTRAELGGRASRTQRAQSRRQLVIRLASAHGGVVCRPHLVAAGVTTDEIRAEVTAGRWLRRGRRTLEIPGAPRHPGVAQHWRALWETGPRAVLDGASALVAAGLARFTPERVDVAVPMGEHVGIAPGVRATRRRRLDLVGGGGLPRVTPEWAAIHAAQLAVSDRQAALVLVMAVQQRIVTGGALQQAWATVARSPRRRVIGEVVALAAGGAHSLGELDFAAACRRWGLPEPTRQQVRRGPRGRIYLDVAWEAHRLAVEIDGIHHYEGWAPADDALRQNELALQGDRVLRVPAVALTVDEAPFMRQVARALGVTPPLVS